MGWGDWGMPCQGPSAAHRHIGSSQARRLGSSTASPDLCAIKPSYGSAGSAFGLLCHDHALNKRRFFGCPNKDCVLCKNNPHKRCRDEDNFDGECATAGECGASAQSSRWQAKTVVLCVRAQSATRTVRYSGPSAKRTSSCTS